MAVHLGLWIDRPMAGCAKSWLIGDYEEPGPLRGARSPLRDGDDVVVVVMRTRDGVKPLSVSVGIGMEAAIDAVLPCGGSCRLPAPTRLAHRRQKHGTSWHSKQGH